MYVCVYMCVCVCVCMCVCVCVCVHARAFVYVFVTHIFTHTKLFIQTINKNGVCACGIYLVFRTHGI